MPLPDERPRQSVANLIGKFETHSKHLSPSHNNPSRSSSVVSNVTGDSAKEEIRDKREWPPKLVPEKVLSGPSRPMPLMIDVNGRKAFVESGTEAILATQVSGIVRQQDHQQVQNEPNTYLENWRKDLPQHTEIEPELATPKPRDEPPAAALPVQNVVSSPLTPKTPPMKPSAAKVPASTSSKSVGASAKSPGKSAWKSTPSKKSLTPSTSAQPLKPQLTGQSVASSASKRTISKASTPARTETGTKTPTFTPRSKTPSSGLFAPTAASLAKARNAPLPPPPPVRKATMSSDTMDRLSRPTAASLSRVKTGPVPAASSPKSPPRMSSIKSKSTISPSKSPQTKIKKDMATPQAPGGSAVVATIADIGVALATEAGPNQACVEVTTNGHPTSKVVEAEVPTNSEVAHAHQETEEPAFVELVEPAALSQTPASPEADSVPYDFTNVPEIEGSAPKTSLEDIVNLLETGAVSRPSAEEISEIPDED